MKSTTFPGICITYLMCSKTPQSTSNCHVSARYSPGLWQGTYHRSGLRSAHARRVAVSYSASANRLNYRRWTWLLNRLYGLSARENSENAICNLLIILRLRVANHPQVDSQLLAFLVEVAAFEAQRLSRVRHVVTIAF